MREAYPILSTPVWQPAPARLTLGPAEVHVWRAALDLREPVVRRLWQLLAPDEQARAERYVFPKDRTHFLVARGLLRVLLGRYVQRQPQLLRFCYGPHGKPELAPDMADTLRFNVSHSHGLALYAITRQRDIGVDVEYVRPGFAEERIAERFFSPREVAVLRALPGALQTTAFFACWTRKEAFIKARGDGLSLPLDQFDVAFTPGEPATLLYTAWDPSEAARWTIRDLAPGPDYMGAVAVAVAGPAWQLTCWLGPETYVVTD
jgi:4'-phosphopantetheinyl transferase